MPKQPAPFPFSVDDRDPLVIKEDTGPDMRNIRTDREKILRMPGSVQFGTGTIEGRTRNFQQLFDASVTGGDERLYMFQSDRLYRYDDTIDTWIPVTYIVGESDSGNPVSFTADEIERWSTVYTLGAGFFTRAEEDEVYRLSALGVNRFSSLGFMPIGKTSMGAYVILPFAGRLILVRTREDGVDEKTRIRWHVVLDPADWNSTGAGFLEIRDESQAPLIGAGVLGERAYLFKERQIIELIQTGNAEDAFHTEIKILGTGCIARHSWATAEYFGFFVGPDNIYMWDGSNLTPIGDPIYKTFFAAIDYGSSPGFMAPSKIQGIVHTPNSEYRILVQAAPSSGPNMFVFDYRRNRWYTDRYTPVSAHGAIRIGGLLSLGIIPDQDQSEIILYGLNDALPERETKTTYLRNGETFDAYITTKDFAAVAVADKATGMKSLMGPSASLDEMNSCWELMFRGAPFSRYLIAFSTDSGANFSSDESVQANSDGVVRYFFGPVIFMRIRFRIKSYNDFIDAVGNVQFFLSNKFVIELDSLERYKIGMIVRYITVASNPDFVYNTITAVEEDSGVGVITLQLSTMDVGLNTVQVGSVFELRQQMEYRWTPAGVNYGG